MKNLNPGDRVEVTLKAAMIQAIDRNGYLTVKVGCDEITFDPDEEGVTVTYMGPEEWPPKPGDVWSDGDNDLWFAFEEVDGRIELLKQINGSEMDPDDVLNTCPPMTLRFRPITPED